MHAKGIALFHVINETTRRSFGDHHDDIYEQIMNTETKKRLIRKSTLNMVPKWDKKGEACGFPYIQKGVTQVFIRRICQRIVWDKYRKYIKVITKYQSGRKASFFSSSIKLFPFLFFSFRIFFFLGLVGVGRTLGYDFIS